MNGGKELELADVVVVVSGVSGASKRVVNGEYTSSSNDNGMCPCSFAEDLRKRLI